MTARKIGAWWLRSQEALDDEVVLRSFAANRRLARMYVVGGKLYITSRRLMFCPHWIDAINPVAPWWVAKEDVQSAMIAAPEVAPIAIGNVRSTVHVVDSSGVSEHFVVFSPTKTVEAVNRWLES